MTTTYTPVMFNGKLVDVNQVRAKMDPDLADEVYKYTTSPQEFVNTYVYAHEEMFGEQFKG